MSEATPRGHPSSGAPDPQSRIGFGLVLALVAANVFGFVTPLARYSYEFGANPVTAALFRVAFGAIGATIMMVILRRSLRIPKAGILPTLGVTVTLAAAALCYLSAVAFIPVSLGVLIFYTYPLMIAAFTTLFQRAPLGALRAIAFVVAFAGLAIAFGPSFDVIDGLGVLLAFAAAVFLAALFIFSAQALRHVGITTITFYSNVGAIPIIVGGVFLLGGLALPTADAGWIGLVGSSLCYAVGIFLHFAAIGFAGPARTAMIFNLEPIVAVILAATLLGESLTPVQYAGGALVIGALVLATLAERRDSQA